MKLHAWDCPCGTRNAPALAQCRRCGASAALGAPVPEEVLPAILPMVPHAPAPVRRVLPVPLPPPPPLAPASGADLRGLLTVAVWVANAVLFLANPFFGVLCLLLVIGYEVLRHDARAGR